MINPIYTLLFGDCKEVMARMQPDSVSAVVCDPPYGIGFMGREWDGAAIAAAAARDRETRTSLGPESSSRPNRSQSRSSSAFGNEAIIAGPVRGGEDFERWCEGWAREALRILKPGAHILAFGGTRTSHRLVCGIEDAGFEIRDTICWLYGQGFAKSHNLDGDGDGWGTALKPAHEPVVIARKPFSGTVSENFSLYGTAVLNIDGCRVGVGAGGDRNGEPSAQRRYTQKGSTNFAATPGPRGGDARGRWPANLIIDEHVSEQLDKATGHLKGGGDLSGNGPTSDGFSGVVYGNGSRRRSWKAHGDSGGASRFFYCAKASPKERNWGLGEEKNIHPTVKPISLMRYLVRLVTPARGLVLDAFAGSGSTLIAATLEGFDSIGIEREQEYFDIAQRRVEYWAQNGPPE